ncbi:MAG: phosphorylase [Caldisphaera sp.]|nr:MAG: phosphorylase [Caldisphaera sp.]
MVNTVHILANKVPKKMLITGDPDRIKLIAKLLNDLTLINSNRGFYTYAGTYNKEEIGLASHGIGGPSVAIVLEELISLGAEYIIRLGTIGSLFDEINVGDVIIPNGVSYLGNASALGLYFSNICYPSSPDANLSQNLLKNAVNNGFKVHRGIIFSSDSFYAEGEILEKLKKLNIIGVEMECATLLALSNLRGIKSSCFLIVSNKAYDKFKKEFYIQEEAILNAARTILDVLSKN